jgi:hypothetical protein
MAPCQPAWFWLGHRFWSWWRGSVADGQLLPVLGLLDIHLLLLHGHLLTLERNALLLGLGSSFSLLLLLLLAPPPPHMDQSSFCCSR